MKSAPPCPRCGAPGSPTRDGGPCPQCLARALSPAGDTSQASWAADNLAGERLGDYELRGLIACGGMGRVYRARHLALDREVALKMVTIGSLAGGPERDRFRREAEAVAQLEHPNIIPVYDVAEADGQPFFTMRLVDGGSLADRVEAPDPRRTAGQRQALVRLMVKVARAVDYAHQCGILHRDLKPANILLDAAGEPFVADFGLAKRLDGPRFTATQDLLGTPHYMSPEQVSGPAKLMTTSADIYSLGAILYELLTGLPPFDGDTVAAILRRIESEEPARPRTVAPDIERDLETICLKCLAKQPRNRYPTAAALADDLDRWLRHEPILARPVSPLERTIKWMRRNPALASLIAVAPLAVAAGVMALASRQMARLEAQGRQHVARLLDTANYATALREASHALAAGDFRQAQVLLTPYEDGPTNVLVSRGPEWWWLWQQVASSSARPHAGHVAAIAQVAFSPDGRHVASLDISNRVIVWTFPAMVRAGSFQSSPIPRWSRPDMIEPGGPGSLHFPANHIVLAPAAGLKLVAWSLPEATLSSTQVARRLAFGAWDERGRSIQVAWDKTPAVYLCTGDAERQRLPFFARWAGLSATNGVWAALVRTNPGDRVVAGNLDRPGEWHTVTRGNVNHALALSPDGGLLAALGDADREVQVWEVNAPAGDSPRKRPLTPLRTLRGHTQRIRVAAFSRDGTHLATSGDDQVIRYWDLRKTNAGQVLTGHRGPVRALAFAPDDSQLLSGADDKLLLGWNLLPGNDGQSPAPPGGPVEVTGGGWIGFRDTNRLLSLWDPRSANRPPAGIKVPSTAILKVSADGRRLLAMGVSTGAWWIANFGLPGGQLMERHSGPVGRRDRAVEVSDDGSWIVLDNGVGVLRVLEARSGRLKSRLDQTRAGALGSSNLIPGGRRLLVQRTGQQPLIWDWGDSREFSRLNTIPDAETRWSVSPDGTRLAVSGGRQIRLWTLGPTVEEATPLESPVPTVALQFSPRGDRIAALGQDRHLRIWLREIAHPVVDLPPPPEASAPGGERIVWDREGEWLALAPQNGPVKFWGRGYAP